MADLGSINVILSAIRKAVNANRRRIQLVALKDLEGLMKERIFNRGLSTGGRKIGDYSTKDMLIGRSSFLGGNRSGGRPSGPGKASVGQSIFGTKEARANQKWVTLGRGPRRKRLVVLDGGYKKFRSLSGRQTGKVDLEFTSDLRNGIQVGTNKTDLVLGYIEDLQRLKADGNEKRFEKVIFTPSESEIKAMDKAVIREIDAIVSKVLR